MALSAVIFDFDGVLVDTERLHWRAICDVIRPLGHDIGWDDYLSTLVGYNDRETFQILHASWGDAIDDTTIQALVDAKTVSFAQHVSQGVQMYPGVETLVRELAGKTPIALCSGASRTDIEAALAGVAIGAAFDVIVAGDEVSRGKPDPEGYRETLNRLSEVATGMDPARCVAIEDTPTGIAAALAAGTNVLAVTNTFPDNELSEATWIVDSLSEVIPASLALMLDRLGG